ncbi:hypothetical protein V491_01682 [Pseudogymnoascus sp. VKM F-3775]|nr:hypothetical protein V491_01682 [Pseudogymnoascus sp. VKM F-3775]
MSRGSLSDEATHLKFLTSALEVPFPLQSVANVVDTIYAAFISVTGPSVVKATPVAGGFSVAIPEDFNGQLYAVLTSCNETVTDDTIAAGPAIIRFAEAPLLR